MKGMFLGVVGLGGIGTAAYMGGGAGPNDYVGHVGKSPEAVYAAFAGLGQAGEISIPRHDGKGAMVQRVTKVHNELVKLELEVDGAALMTAEVHIAPDGEKGTRVAAEFDLDSARLREVVRDAGGGEIAIPEFAFQETMIDMVFARAMGEMVEQIESGQPLASLSATRARWGSGDGGPSGAAPVRPSGGWQQRSAVRPQMDARPAVDPNRAAREHMARQGSRPGSDSGW